MKAKRVKKGQTVGSATVRPMRIHKNALILFLTEHPDDLLKVCPDATVTAEETIAHLKAQPGEWFVDGALEGEEEEVEVDAGELACERFPSPNYDPDMDLDPPDPKPHQEPYEPDPDEARDSLRDDFPEEFNRRYRSWRK